jgi:hypothetical protein
MRWAGPMRATRNTYNAFVENPEGFIQLGRFKRRWKGNVEINLKGIDCGLDSRLGRVTGSCEHANKFQSP